MQSTDVPVRFPIPFAVNAGASYVRNIPENSQIGVQAGAASLNDGFPPQCFVPTGAGGTPPWGADFNGILRQITEWAQWAAAGGPVIYDGTFAASIGGYPRGAVIAKADLGGVWLCTADNNTTDPDAGGANWLGFDWTGALTTGAFHFRATDEVIPGWVKANATTIGNASSNATQAAAATTWALFAWHWVRFSNTQCPVYTSGGVLTTRGVSAAADFNANKQITVLDMRGTGFMGMDTMGGGATTRLSGVPVVAGGATIAGSVLGENLHALVEAENAPHTHSDHTTNSLNGLATAGPSTPFNYNAGATTTTTGSSGSGTAHNTVQRSMVGTVYLKL